MVWAVNGRELFITGGIKCCNILNCIRWPLLSLAILTVSTLRTFSLLVQSGCGFLAIRVTEETCRKNGVSFDFFSLPQCIPHPFPPWTFCEAIISHRAHVPEELWKRLYGILSTSFHLLFVAQPFSIIEGENNPVFLSYGKQSNVK